MLDMLTEKLQKAWKERRYPSLLAGIQGVALEESSFENGRGESYYFAQVKFQHGTKEALLAAINHATGEDVRETEASMVARSPGELTVILTKSGAEALDKAYKNPSLDIYRGDELDPLYS